MSKESAGFNDSIHMNFSPSYLKQKDLVCLLTCQNQADSQKLYHFPESLWNSWILIKINLSLLLMLHIYLYASLSVNWNSILITTLIHYCSHQYIANIYWQATSFSAFSGASDRWSISNCLGAVWFFYLSFMGIHFAGNKTTFFNYYLFPNPKINLETENPGGILLL